jgi:hypothetical protein
MRLVTAAAGGRKFLALSLVGAGSTLAVTFFSLLIVGPPMYWTTGAITVFLIGGPLYVACQVGAAK